MSVHGNAPATPPGQSGTTPPGQAHKAHVLTDPGKGLARAAALAARKAAWAGQADNATDRANRLAQWEQQ